MKEHIADNDEKSRVAIWMLAQHQKPETLVILQKTLENSSKILRLEVIRNIEKENNVMAIDMLESTSLLDDDPEIRQYASKVVAKLSDIQS